MAGPRSDPPIPILTIVLNFLPVKPFVSPALKASENRRIFSRTAFTSGMTSLPSTKIGLFDLFRNAI